MNSQDLLGCPDFFADVQRPSWFSGINKLYVACPQVNVGIGTDNPRVKLDVMGTSYSQKMAVGNINPTTIENVLFNVSAPASFTASNKLISINGTNAELLSIQNNGKISLKTDLANSDNSVIFNLSNADRDIFSITNKGTLNTYQINASHKFFLATRMAASDPSSRIFNIFNYDQNLLDINNNGTFGFNTASADWIQYSFYSNKNFAFNLKHDMQTDYAISMFIEVNREVSRPIHIKNNLTNKDLFTVWGNGIVNARKIYAEEIEVRTDAMGISWPDYVFENNYELKKLSEVEKYIKENKHLEGVPSQAEIEKAGVNIGEMNAILLKKIEELTLYVIELEKKINKHDSSK